MYILALDWLPVIFLNVSPPSFSETHNQLFKKWSCFQNCYRHADQFGTKSCFSIYSNFNVHTPLAGSQHRVQEMINTHLVTDAQISLVWYVGDALISPNLLHIYTFTNVTQCDIYMLGVGMTHRGQGHNLHMLFKKSEAWSLVCLSWFDSLPPHIMVHNMNRKLGWSKLICNRLATARYCES